MTYAARAWREDSLWVVDVDGVGVTQATTLSKVEHMARALVADLLGAPYESVAVTVEVELPDSISSRVDAARETAARAAALTTEAAELQREVVQRLSADEHLSGQDIAVILKVTPARVSQIRRRATTRRNGNRSDAEPVAATG